ncbi:AMP-binding protein [Noviherbaspirillum autotrophicum]|uniref:Long-chain fatty acid--CoA ligase n=1 Tax=Noviherbaspirillum autotrophicum TaxID=709839 RepID=A0A0C2BXN6_9BURK|nr:AMP-binding protein [Noviherbaspirillum autotrophicum]KIF82791.1 long-chain fatty acid--CoA ligase [Noviherbaspirillum autotrophicum]
MKVDKYPVQMLHQWASQQPDRRWLFQPVNGQWKSLTWAQAADQIARMAAALQAMGWEPGSRIAISGRNTAHWFLADMAIAMAGYVSVGLYPKQSQENTRYILEHSDAKALFLGPMMDADIFMGALPSGLKTIAFPYPEAPAGDMKWDELVAQHGPLSSYQPPAPDALMTLVYTSGTTGKPKGVMLNYGNVLFTASGALSVIPPEPNERYFSYMPLAHAFERVAVEMASFYTGAEVHFLEHVDKLAEQLPQVAPTRFFGVPLVYSRIQAGVLKKLPQPKLERLMAIPLVRGLVRRKIMKGIGLQNARMCVVGAAPMPVPLLDWYRNIGIEIYQGYGMTEASVYPTACLPWQNRVGSVGKPLPDSGFRLSEEGEILFKHGGLMAGYFKEPDLTRDAFTADGFLRTGDKGHVDEDGFLYITGRVKDIFKTAKGKYVAPAPIECAFARNTDIDQLLLIGSGLTQPLMFVTLGEEARRKDRADVEQRLIADMETVNAALEPHERIAKCVILKDAWNIDNGLMTPTMKVRRAEVEKRYRALIERESKVRDAISWE